MYTLLHSASNLCNSCTQAEQQSTEFRIKALGKALEYKHLEVHNPFAEQTFMVDMTLCGNPRQQPNCLPY